MYRRIKMRKSFICERNEIQRMKWKKAKEMDASSFPFLMYDGMTGQNVHSSGHCRAVR